MHKACPLKLKASTNCCRARARCSGPTCRPLLGAVRAGLGTSGNRERSDGAGIVRLGDERQLAGHALHRQRGERQERRGNDLRRPQRSAPDAQRIPALRGPFRQEPGGTAAARPGGLSRGQTSGGRTPGRGGLAWSSPRGRATPGHCRRAVGASCPARHHGPATPDWKKSAAIQARQLLQRWGVVTRQVLDLKRVPGTGTPSCPHLKLMEMRGEVRRGYFVEGLPRPAVCRARSRRAVARPARWGGRGRAGRHECLRSGQPVRSRRRRTDRSRPSASRWLLRASLPPGRCSGGGRPVLVARANGSAITTSGGADDELIQPGGGRAPRAPGEDGASGNGQDVERPAGAGRRGPVHPGIAGLLPRLPGHDLGRALRLWGESQPFRVSHPGNRPPSAPGPHAVSPAAPSPARAAPCWRRGRS